MNTSCDLCVVFASTLRFRQVTLYPFRGTKWKANDGADALCLCLCLCGRLTETESAYLP